MNLGLWPCCESCEFLAADQQPRANDWRLPMPKQATSLPLSLSAPTPGTPLYRWFYDELRSAILGGRIAPGARLPATRDLAQEYRLSRATVVTAFEQLKSEGYVEGKIGAGTYVSQVLPDDLLQVARTSAGGSAGPRRVGWSSYARRLRLFRGGEHRVTRAFRANLAALDAFPTTLWAQVAARRLRRASTQLLAGGEALGYRPLRQAVAEYLNASRGVKCSAEQVLIISGVQEALERAAHLLLDPGDPVWVEEPGYPGAAIVFRAVGAKVCPVPRQAGLRDACAPVPFRGDHEPAPAAGAAGVGSPFSHAHPRRRLRQRVPLFGPTHPGAAGARSRRGSHLCRQL